MSLLRSLDLFLEFVVVDQVVLVDGMRVRAARHRTLHRLPGDLGEDGGPLVRVATVGVFHLKNKCTSW